MNIVRQLDRDLDDVDPLTALGEAVRTANRHLGELVAADPSVEGMGTTLEAMLWDGQRFVTAHIGDSRAYRLRDGALTQLSSDHTFVQSLVDEGKLTPDEARGHPHRSLLLRVLLGRDDNEPDLDHVEGQLGDRYLLCSDGLTDMVDDADIARALGAETIDMAATDSFASRSKAAASTTSPSSSASSSTRARNPTRTCRRQMDSPSSWVPPPAGPAPAPGTRPATATSRCAADPEELRYAPRPPGGWRLGTALVIGGRAAARDPRRGRGLRLPMDARDQYFVGRTPGPRHDLSRRHGRHPGHLAAARRGSHRHHDVLPAGVPSRAGRCRHRGVQPRGRRPIVTELDDSVPEPRPSPSPPKKDDANAAG